ncbi:SUKH-3 domain-containing protein [Streptomyces sp. NPDC056373]|uniref:SUKH-3 domain-containing protein n=1 Tax=Streptomyces sp. NPDC056373 TaxID=3345798 RepID=UPI0035D76D12
MGESLTACGPPVLDALGAAGWTAGRKIAITDWTRQLTGARFEPDDVAVAVWTEFGELTIESSSTRAPVRH